MSGTMILRALACVMAVGWGLSASAAPPDRPNVVIILADDMGYGDVACYNPQSKIATPHIDRLAREGLRFTDGHAPAAWCTPTRYALLTGRCPFRLPEIRAHKPLIEPTRLTIASLLQRVGYRTACVGKWHLGVAHEKDPGDKRLDGGPVDCGFDEYFGLPASLDIPDYYYIRNDRAVKPPTIPIAARNSADWTEIQGKFWRAGRVAEGYRHEEVLPTLTAEALAFLRRHQQTAARQPFLLYFPLTAPHTPWLPAERFRGKSGAGMYGDFVMQVDDVVGQVLAALDELKLTENTLVLFTSDNGPTWYPADVERFGHSAAGPWRGMKGDAAEGGHRVPLLVRWPGVVKSGSTCEEAVTLTDTLATLAAITGQNLPADAGEDSTSILPLLQGQPRIEREAVILRASQFNVIRSGPWKLVFGLGSGGFTRPARIPRGPNDPPGQLYNLVDDPKELRNAYNEHPDVAARLTKLMDKYTSDGRSTPVR